MGLNVSPCLMDSYKRRGTIQRQLALRASVASSTRWSSDRGQRRSSPTIHRVDSSASQTNALSTPQWPRARQRTPTKIPTLDFLFFRQTWGRHSGRTPNNWTIRHQLNSNENSSVLSSSGTPSLWTRDKVSQNDSRSNRSGPKTRGPGRRRVHLSLLWRAQPSRAWQRVCVFGHDEV